jgi:hypothetical protein
MIFEWKIKVEDFKKLEKNEYCLCKCIAKKTDLEAEVKNWITDCRNNQIPVYKKREFLKQQVG